MCNSEMLLTVFKNITVGVADDVDEPQEHYKQVKLIFTNQ